MLSYVKAPVCKYIQGAETLKTRWKKQTKVVRTKATEKRQIYGT